MDPFMFGRLSARSAHGSYLFAKAKPIETVKSLTSIVSCHPVP
jgi:hypothetical protein